MKTVIFTILDEFGNITNDPQKHTYQLNQETGGFNGIEKAVIDLKCKMLPDIQKQLLEEEQEEFVQNKDASFSCNGTTPVTIKTLNGSFTFKNQRFLDNDSDKTSQTYLGLTNQFEDGYTSDSLKEFSTYYANRLSYEETEELVKRTSGEKLLSDQSIHNIVVDKALEQSKQVEFEALSVLEDDTLKLPEINQEVDIYDAETKEVLILVDGIGVKKQSESRVSKKKAGMEAESDTEKKTGSRVSNNIVLLEKEAGGFEYITSAIDEDGEELLPLSNIVKSKVIQEYGKDVEPVNMVSISDGAKDIRSLLKNIFGIVIVIILDWYHLGKKVREFMSMIARNKSEKIEHLEFLLHNLWHGQTDEVLNYLKTQVIARNEGKLQELITYIEKHQEEIIDYDRRKEAGKEIGKEPDQEEGNEEEVVQHQQSSNIKTVDTDGVSIPCDSIKKRKHQKPLVADLNRRQEDVKIKNKPSSNTKGNKKVVGSGRVEKACDSTIGKRQKHKAMSWSKVGSRSLAILKVVELNHKWSDIWFHPASNDLQRAANDPCCTSELELVA
jgi:hypothetical protein